MSNLFSEDYKLRPELYDQLPFLPKVRHDHPDTAHAAAEAAKPSAPTQRATVLALLRDGPLGGYTDEQMQLLLGMNPSTQRPRRIELVEQGAVRNSGVKRRTRSGREAVVWESVI